MERSFPFNAVVTDGVPDRVYTAEDFASERAAYVSDGVLAEGALAVSPGTGLTLTVAAGRAVIRGYTYENTSPMTLPLAPADAALPRRDRLVLRLDLAQRRMYCAVLTGTPAADPAVPDAADGTLVKELPLCAVRIAPGAVSVRAEDLEDQRTRADYVLNRLDAEAVVARWEAALEAFFGLSDARAIARAAAVVSTSEGEDTVLHGDGTYQPLPHEGLRRVELIRYDAPGTYVFSPDEHPSEGGVYEVVLQGAGGSGAHGLTASGARGGSAGAYVTSGPLLLRTGVRCSVTVGAGGAGVTQTAGAARGGLPGGETVFAVLGERFTASGGPGGGVAGNRTYPPDEGPRGGTATAGGASLFADGGANYIGASGGDGAPGSLGSGGGTGYTPAYAAARSSGAGGNGCVVVYGWERV